MNLSAAKTLLEQWRKQTALFKELETDCETEIPPEMIPKSEYYRDLAAHTRANIRDLKTLLDGPQ